MSVIGQDEGIDHGTTKGYRQHCYRKVDACEPCLQAHSEYNARKRAEREANPVQRSAAQLAWYGGKFTTPQDEAAPKRSRTRKPKTTKDEAAGPAPLPETGNPAWGVPIHGRDLALGDALVHLGRHYTVDRFESYTGSLRAELGADTRTAYSGDWGITVGPNAIIRILPKEGAR